MPRAAVASSAVIRSALASWPIQAATREDTSTRASLSRTTSSARKFSPTKSPRLSPSTSFFVGMIAVWGIGRPSGCRKSAVTANQSASAPTMAASAVARTYPIHVGPSLTSHHRASRNTTVAASSSPVASAFIRRRSRSRVAASTRPTPRPTSTTGIVRRAGRPVGPAPERGASDRGACGICTNP